MALASNPETAMADPRSHACQPCKAAKKRCDGKIPCARCERRGEVAKCRPPSPTKRRKLTMAELDEALFGQTFQDLAILLQGWDLLLLLALN